MSYPKNEDELRKEELRKEAEHDSAVIEEREKAKKKALKEAHIRVVKMDIERLETKRAQAELQIRALEMETRQLESVVRKGRGATTRESTSAVRSEEREMQNLRSHLEDLVHDEHETERDIQEHERSLNRARDSVRETEYVEDRGRTAQTRKEAQEAKIQELKKEASDLHRDIEALRRELTL